MSRRVWSQLLGTLSAAEKNGKEVELPSSMSPQKVVATLQELQKNTSLENLTLTCNDQSVWTALGSFLQKSTSIKSLTISVYYSTVIEEEFLRGLQSNTSLTKLELTDLPTLFRKALRERLYTEVEKALKKNSTSIKIKKQGYRVCFDIQRFDPARILPEQLFAADEWSWEPEVVYKPPSISSARQLIQNNDWEKLARHLKENCSSTDPADYAKEFNLSTRTFVDKLAIHTLKEHYEDTCEESVILEVSIIESTKLRQTLSNEQEELKRRLQTVEQKLVEVDATLVENSTKLKENTQLIQQLITNLEKFKASLAKNEPKLTQWQRKLQVDMSDWTIEDVSFLLKEVDLGQYADEFAVNKIDGAVLQTLDTSDLTANLNVSFKDAKRLLMYVYLADKHHDIYNIPPGVLQWNNDTVCTWLEDNKFAHLVDLFKKNQITGAELAFLEKGDLTAQLKIQAFGDVVKLQKEIAKLKDSLNDEQTRAMQTINNNNANNNNDQLVQQLEEVKRFNEELKIALKKKETKIPEAFICPITQDIMTDPVVASDGHTYERTAIELWLKNKNSSPMTGLQLANKDLTPSHTLKSMIREFVDTNKN